MSDNHTTRLAQTHPSGVQEWKCLQCTRRIIIQSNPYVRLVLDEGEENAVHSGTIWGGEVEVSVSPDTELPRYLTDLIDGMELQ